MERLWQFFSKLGWQKIHNINDFLKYFQTPKSFGGRVKVELDLSNYVTKAALKIATVFDTSDFVKKADRGNLKSGADKSYYS